MSRPRIGSLCTGYGGLDMAVAEVYGGETVWVSDIDKGANKILAHRYPDIPNLGDFTQTDWGDVEDIDILTAGFPCQPVSKVGRRAGDNDERWLWDDISRAVGELRPGIIVLENVRGLLTIGRGRPFGRVLGSLAELGYDADWLCIRACDIGAPHERERVFAVASSADAHRITSRPAHRSVGNIAGGERPKGAAHHGHARLGAALLARRSPGSDLDGWREYAPLIARWERIVGLPAPRLDDDLATITEWMMGLPAGWVTDVPGITRNEALKALGNGVVPQQAAEALRVMASWEVAA